MVVAREMERDYSKGEKFKLCKINNSWRVNLWKITMYCIF